jgi:hypothetical protein
LIGVRKKARVGVGEGSSELSEGVALAEGVTDPGCEALELAHPARSNPDTSTATPNR